MKLALKWLAGVLFLFAGLAAVVTKQFATGVLFILAGAICIPPIFKQYSSLFKNKITTPVKYILVVGFWLAGALLFKNNKPGVTGKTSKVDTVKKEETPIEDNSVMAYIMAKDIVKDHLKAPRSANFPWSPEVSRFDGKKQDYVLQFYVDATNSFGGEIRSTFLIILHYNGGEVANIKNWDLVSLEQVK